MKKFSKRIDAVSVEENSPRWVLPASAGKENEEEGNTVFKGFYHCERKTVLPELAREDRTSIQ